MMREGLLKENIDGEALDWAHKRLLGAHRAAPDPDDDLRRRAGRRLHAVGQSRQLSRAASALGDRGDRDPLAGRADRHRHRPRRDALLPPRGHHRRRRGTRRRDDREARRTVRRERRGRAARARCRAAGLLVAGVGTLLDPRTPGAHGVDRHRHGEAKPRYAAVVLVAALAVHAALPSAAPKQRGRRRAGQHRDHVRARSRRSTTREPDRRRSASWNSAAASSCRSSHKEFGGISAIMSRPTARVSRRHRPGCWLRGRIVYQRQAAGRHRRRRDRADARSRRAPADGARLVRHRGARPRDGGTLYVGIERVHRIVRFDYGKRRAAARAGGRSTVPPAFRSCRTTAHRGLVVVPRGAPLGGALIAISERGLDEAGDIRAFLIGGPRPGTFTVKRSETYDISDARCCRMATS